MTYFWSFFSYWPLKFGKYFCSILYIYTRSCIYVFIYAHNDGTRAADIARHLPGSVCARACVFQKKCASEIRLLRVHLLLLLLLFDPLFFLFYFIITIYIFAIATVYSRFWPRYCTLPATKGERPSPAGSKVRAVGNDEFGTRAADKK